MCTCGDRWLEQDPDMLVKSVKKCLDEVGRRHGHWTVKVVGITNQRETTVVWDKTTGKPLHNAICKEGEENINFVKVCKPSFICISVV